MHSVLLKKSVKLAALQIEVEITQNWCSHLRKVKLLNKYTNPLWNMRCFFSISYFIQMYFFRQKTYQKQNYSSRFQARKMKSFHFEELLAFFLLNIRKKSILQAHTLILLAGFHLWNREILLKHCSKSVNGKCAYCLVFGFSQLVSKYLGFDILMLFQMFYH